MSKSTFEELSRDVDWETKSFLAHCRKAIYSTGLPGNKSHPNEIVVQNILGAYRYLADQFYGQFRSTLKDAYDREMSRSAQTTEDLINVPVLLQIALTKLIVEWDHVCSVIAAIRVCESREATAILDPLTPVVHAAIRGVGLSPEMLPIVLQFGQSFNLGFFDYTDDLVSLSLPPSVLKSPWEWTILWHELAGEKTRLLKSAQQEFQNLIEGLLERCKDQPGVAVSRHDIQNALGSVLNKHFKRLDTDTQKYQDEFLADLSSSVQADLQSHQSYFQQGDSTPALATYLGKSPDLPLIEINGFFQKPSRPLIMLSFERLLADIEYELDPDVLDIARDAGWSADWLEEMFSDSFSVINFPDYFLPVFEQLLRRYPDGGKGLRHPPHALRLAVAVSLRLQTLKAAERKPGRRSSVGQWPSRQKMRLAAKGFEINLNQLGEATMQMVHLVARKTLTLHSQMNISHSNPADRQAKEVLKTAMQAMLNDKDGNERDKIYDEAHGELVKLARLPTARPNKLSKESIRKDFPLVDKLLLGGTVLKPKPLTYVKLAQLEFGYKDFADAGDIAAANQSLASQGTSSFLALHL